MTVERRGVHRATFIVRLDWDELGRVTGVAERVRTGEKARVDALASLGQVVAAMLARDGPDPRPAREAG